MLEGIGIALIIIIALSLVAITYMCLAMFREYLEYLRITKTLAEPDLKKAEEAFDLDKEKYLSAKKALAEYDALQTAKANKEAEDMTNEYFHLNEVVNEYYNDMLEGTDKK